MKSGKSSMNLGNVHDGGIFHTPSFKLFPEHKLIVDAIYRCYACCVVKNEVVNHTPHNKGELFRMRFFSVTLGGVVSFLRNCS